jgi:triacylglycerol esterase/lipase EstA (alpha/beta hydrolase family)
VLLVHGTNVTPEENWGWNYGHVLPDLGFDVCTVALPGRARVDAQVSSQYVVYAIRRVAQLSGRKVDIISHSQGTLQPRWAMRWWPDVAAHVDDYISLAGVHHGIASADGLCAGGSCYPAAWQMRTTSAFVKALNTKWEVARGVSATSIYSETDELVQPYETALLRGASNIAVQDVCPGRAVDHVSMADDGVVFQIVMDALTHRGPFDARRVHIDCTDTFMPGVNPVLVAGGQAGLYGGSSSAFFNGNDNTDHEPPLATYARS